MTVLTLLLALTVGNAGFSSYITLDMYEMIGEDGKKRRVLLDYIVAPINPITCIRTLAGKDGPKIGRKKNRGRVFNAPQYSNKDGRNGEFKNVIRGSSCVVSDASGAMRDWPYTTSSLLL